MAIVGNLCQKTDLKGPVFKNQKLVQLIGFQLRTFFSKTTSFQ